MDMKDRNNIRKLQDRVIEKLRRKGFEDNSIVFTHGATVTVKNLKEYLYPGWEPELKQFLEGRR